QNMEFEEVDTQLPWRLRPLFACQSKNSFAILEPGKTFEASITLNPSSDNYKHEFFCPIPEGKQERKRPRLDAGRYRLSIRRDFAAGMHPSGTHRLWSGQIATNALDFEIVPE